MRVIFETKGSAVTTLVWVRGSADGPIQRAYVGRPPAEMGALPLAAYHLLTAQPDATPAFGGGQTLYGSDVVMSWWLREKMREVIEFSLGDFELIAPFWTDKAHERLLRCNDAAYLDPESDMDCAETIAIVQRAQQIGAASVIDVSHRRIAQSVAGMVKAQQSVGNWPADLAWTQAVANVG